MYVNANNSISQLQNRKTGTQQQSPATADLKAKAEMAANRDYGNSRKKSFKRRKTRYEENCPL
jgi:hypothetical protein